MTKLIIKTRYFATWQHRNWLVNNNIDVFCTFIPYSIKDFFQ